MDAADEADPVGVAARPPAGDESGTGLRFDELARRDRAKRQCRAWSALFWVLAVSDAVLALVTWRTWPDPRHVPVHVGDHGVDAWGSATSLLTADLVLLGVMVVAGPLLGRLLPRVPMDLANSPCPDYWKTPDRWPVSLALVRAFLMAVMAGAMLLVCATQWGFLELARGRSFPGTPIWACGGLLGLQLVAGTALVWRAHRPPAWWRGATS